MIRTASMTCLLGLTIALGGCGANPQPTPARMASSPAPTHSATLGEHVITAQVIPTRMLDASVTRRYGIDREEDRALLLITLRSAAGDAIAVDGLTLDAQAGELHASATPVPLRLLQVDGFTDYAGTLQATPPASLRIAIQAHLGDSRAELAFTHDWLP